jgi:hypothetical protein
MQNLRLFTLLILCWLMGSGSIVGQPQAPVSATQSPDPGLATVYVYRLDESAVASNLFFWFKKTRPVYFSERLGGVKRKNRTIASLRNKQYFMVRLPPGKYIFDTRATYGNLELDVVAGLNYYLWVDQGSDCPDSDSIGFQCDSRNASVVIATVDRWQMATFQLKPIKSGNVKDRQLVIVPPGPPSRKSS